MIVEPTARQIRRYGDRRKAHFGPPPPPAGVGTRLLGPDAAAAPPGPPPGMTLWLKRGTFAAGTWPDASGNGFDAVGPGGAGNPTAGLLNGRVSPSFNPASSQYLGVQGAVTTILGGPSAQVWALFAVFSYTGATAFDTADDTPPILMHNPGPAQLWGACVGILAGVLNVCGFNYEETGSTVLVPIATVGGPTASTHFMSSIATGSGVGGQLATAIDGGVASTHPGTAGVVLIAGQTLAIGGPGNPPVGGHPFWQGLVGEILVYVGPSGGVPLTGPQIAQVNAYLATF